MRLSRVFIVPAALVLGAALSVVPLQVAGAQSPNTSVLVPSSGATLSGSTILDAAASNATSVKFLLFGGSYGYAAPVVCTATATYYGWLCSWNTTTVPNGTYGLVSEASGPGGTAYSSGVGITVDNPPPSTTVLVPASGATQNSTQNQVFDAGASPGVAKVSFDVTVDGDTIALNATPTLYGWIYVASGEPCSAGCSSVELSASVQSVASYLGGESGTSPPVYFTLIYYMQIPP